jgi:hypothetical protein
MPKTLDRYSHKTTLDIDEERFKALKDWIDLNLTDAMAAMKPLEQKWARLLSMYEAVPERKTRNVPVENAPNVEVPIGATACDTITAQAIDTIFSVKPVLTVSPSSKANNMPDLVEKAKAMQRFCNKLAESDDVGFREAAETAILNDAQLGTGVLYVPWVERVYKTKTAKVVSRGPKIRAIAPEDVIVPSGTTGDINEMRLFGFNFRYTETELNSLAKANGLDITEFHPLGARNQVRTTREILGQHMEGPTYKGDTYDVQLLFIYFDIDDDGFDEDLMVIYNHSGNAIGHITYNPMDRRPVEKMVYQQRAHMFFGLGVMEMMQPFEEKLTDIHNYATLNMLLVNSRMWFGDGTAPDDLPIMPGGYLNGLPSKDSIFAIPMADLAPSIYQEQGALMKIANDRVGINDAISPGNVPNRTPGVTTMSMLQQVNKRFTPAFDSMRFAIAGAIKQCVYRYQERVLAKDQKAMLAIYEMLGREDGDFVIDVMENDHFARMMDIELTASSAYRNAMADRQDAATLAQIAAAYQDRIIQLANAAAAPTTPPAIREILSKAVHASNEMFERTLRTYDSVRDPKTFMLDVADQMGKLDEAAAQAQQMMAELVAQQAAGEMQAQEAQSGMGQQENAQEGA